MKRSPRTRGEAPDALLLEASRGLAHEPRLLTDAHLLGALHAELTSQQTREAAMRSLFQLGLLHGLRDSLRAAALLGERSRNDPGAGPAAPLLSIALEPRPSGTPRGEVAIVGRWPAAHEAGARLMRLGRSDSAACGLSSGYTAGWYSGLLERELIAVERSCVAQGDATCRFELRDAQAWVERRDPQALSLLEDLPFQTLRELAARPCEPGPEPAPERPGARPQHGDDAPAVHVWGPVMVMPYSGAEQALRALELIGSDPAAREVSVVIVDLAGAFPDECPGVAALEKVVSAIEGWGAEPVLAGLTLLPAHVVSQLEQQHLFVHKDLPFAIASAFQIAGAQRWTV